MRRRTVALAAASLGLHHIVFAVLVLGGLAVFAAWRWFQATERSLDATVAVPKVTVPPGGQEFVRISVQNLADRSMDVRVAVSDTPAEWIVGATVDELSLGPGSQDDVWVALGPSASAIPGSVGTVVLEVQSGLARWRSEELTIYTTVESPAQVGPTGA